MIGKHISPILSEIEATLWESECHTDLPPEFTDDAFKSALKIFMAVSTERIYKLQKSERMPLNDACNMVESFGIKLSQLVKTYIDIDTKSLY